MTVCKLSEQKCTACWIAYSSRSCWWARGYMFTKDEEAPTPLLWWSRLRSWWFYNLLTDSEWGLVKLIPMKVHLMLDVVSGVILAIWAWLFSFANHLWIPNVLLGALQIGMAILTSMFPYEKANFWYETLAWTHGKVLRIEKYSRSLIKKLKVELWFGIEENHMGAVVNFLFKIKLTM